MVKNKGFLYISLKRHDIKGTQGYTDSEYTTNHDMKNYTMIHVGIAQKKYIFSHILNLELEAFHLNKHQLLSRLCERSSDILIKLYTAR